MWTRTGLANTWQVHCTLQVTHRHTWGQGRKGAVSCVRSVRTPQDLVCQSMTRTFFWRQVLAYFSYLYRFPLWRVGVRPGVNSIHSVSGLVGLLSWEWTGGLQAIRLSKKIHFIYWQLCIISVSEFLYKYIPDLISHLSLFFSVSVYLYQSSYSFLEYFTFSVIYFIFVSRIFHVHYLNSYSVSNIFQFQSSRFSFYTPFSSYFSFSLLTCYFCFSPHFSTLRCFFVHYTSASAYLVIIPVSKHVSVSVYLSKL